MTAVSLLKESHGAFAQRMSVLADLVGSVNKLALKSGISQSGIRNYFEGGEATRPVLMALARAAGVHVSWLVTGTGPMRPIHAEARAAVTETFLRYCRNRELDSTPETCAEFVNAYNDGVVARAAELATLSVYELRQWVTEYLEPAAAAGEFVSVPFYDLDTVTEQSFTPQAQAAARKSALLGFRRDLVIDTWKLDAEKLCLFTVRSEEMYPMLRPGDWVLCDTREQKLQRNGIYVISKDENILIRRIQFLEAKRIRLMCESQLRDSADAVGDGAEECAAGEVYFIGRVVWYGRRMRL